MEIGKAGSLTSPAKCGSATIARSRVRGTVILIPHKHTFDSANHVRNGMSSSSPPTQGEDFVNSVASNLALPIDWRSEQIIEDAIIKCPAEKEIRLHLSIEVEFTDANRERIVTLGIFVCRVCGNLHTKKYNATVSLGPEFAGAGVDSEGPANSSANLEL